jgi:hypothetical protein
MFGVDATPERGRLTFPGAGPARGRERAGTRRERKEEQMTRIASALAALTLAGSAWAQCTTLSQSADNTQINLFNTPSCFDGLFTYDTEFWRNYTGLSTTDAVSSVRFGVEVALPNYVWLHAVETVTTTTGSDVGVNDLTDFDATDGVYWETGSTQVGGRHVTNIEVTSTNLLTASPIGSVEIFMTIGASNTATIQHAMRLFNHSTGTWQAISAAAGNLTPTAADKVIHIEGLSTDYVGPAGELRAQIVTRTLMPSATPRRTPRSSTSSSGGSRRDTATSPSRSTSTATPAPRRSRGPASPCSGAGRWTCPRSSTTTPTGTSSLTARSSSTWA